MHTAHAIGLGLLISAGVGGASWAQTKKPEPPRDAFTALDKDGDGKVSRQELRGLLDRVDADNDGFITRDELAKVRLAGGEKRPAEGLEEKAPPAQAQLLEHLKALDKDGDGTVGLDEFEGPAPLFDRLDANKDGRITKDEALQFAKQAPGGNPQQAFMEQFRAQDQDNDGTVSRDEFRGPAPLFDRLDANQDGLITKDEVAQHLRSEAEARAGAKPAPAGVLDKLRAMDEDGDGKVSLQEFDGPEALFDRLDADKDGAITKDEGTRFAKQAAETAGPQALIAKIRAMDKDGDTKVGRDEFQGPAPLFDQIDADQDGFLTKDEAVRFAETASGGRPGQDGTTPKPTKPAPKDGGAKPDKIR